MAVTEHFVSRSPRGLVSPKQTRLLRMPEWRRFHRNTTVLGHNGICPVEISEGCSDMTTIVEVPKAVQVIVDHSW